MQAELEARLDFDEDLPALDAAALASRIAVLAQQVQACSCIAATACMHRNHLNCSPATGIEHDSAVASLALC